CQKPLVAGGAPHLPEICARGGWLPGWRRRPPKDGIEGLDGSSFTKIYRYRLCRRTVEWFAGNARSPRDHGFAPDAGGRLVLCFAGRALRWARFSAASCEARGGRGRGGAQAGAGGLEWLCDYCRSGHPESPRPIGLEIPGRFCTAAGGGWRVKRQDHHEGTGSLGTAAKDRYALERGQFQQRYRRAVDVAAVGEDASGGGVGSRHQPPGRAGAAAEDDSTE